MHSIGSAVGQQRLEAARYALLRHLSSALGHQMLVHLQPIGMVAHVIGRRLDAEAPDLDRLALDLGKLQDFARRAVAANLDAVAWLAPEPQQRIGLDTVIAECVDALRGHFSVRGFHLQQVAGGAEPVRRAMVRPLLAAALFALTDDTQAPAEVRITGHGDPAGPLVEIQVHPLPEGDAVAFEPDYRALRWDELEALAGAEGALLDREAAAIRITLPAAA